MLGNLVHMQQRRLTTTEARYTCKYCHKVFVMEGRYLDHQCKQMKREEEFKSPTGQAAWHYYSLWLRQQKKQPPPAASFLTSKFFRTFNNFVNFVKSVDLPKPDKFIWYMVRKNYPPTMWMSDDVYTMYLEFVDREFTPLEQANLSVNTLFSVAEKHDVDVSEVFSVITGQELLQLLRCRKLSPWLLLNSKKFKQLYVNGLQTEQRIICDQLIRPEFWAEKKASNAESWAAIREIALEMGI